MQQPDKPGRRSFPGLTIFGLTIKAHFVAVTIFGMVLLAAFSVYRGKDANYDLHNYHYYACYCFENGRIGIDLYAAQLVTYLNPIGYLPFCWAIDHLKPITAGIVFGSLAGLNFGLLYILSWTVLSGTAERNRIWLSLLTALAGVASPLFLSLVGTSFTDGWTPLLVLLGLLAALRSSAFSSWRYALVAGILLGFATGIKLVNGLYALALLLTICTTLARPAFLRRAAAYCAGALSGALLVGGPWAYALMKEFRNPFFPFFNGVFKSPYFPPVNASDLRWKARTLAQALEFPFQWAAGNGVVSSESPFRDLRFAVFFVLLLPALAVTTWRSSNNQAAGEPRTEPSLFNPADRKLILWFFTLSYLVWAFTFGHQRYATPLELLCGLAILALCDCLIENRGAKQRAFIALALLGIFWVKLADWGRRPWGDTWFEAGIPSELRTAGALYVIPDSATSAYIFPMLPADNQFVRLESNEVALPPDRWLGPRARRSIEQHRGPLRILEGERFNLEILAGYGVSVNRNDCLMVKSNADQFTVCSAYRTAAGAASAVPLTRNTDLGLVTIPSHLRSPEAKGVEAEVGWLRVRPPAGPLADLRPRARFDTKLILTLRPAPGSTQLSGEIRFIPEHENASIIVDLIWYRGSIVVGRSSPSSALNAAGIENSIQLLSDRPASADSLQLWVRPWRNVDAIVTVTGGYLKWSKRD